MECFCLCPTFLHIRQRSVSRCSCRRPSLAWLASFASLASLAPWRPDGCAQHFLVSSEDETTSFSLWFCSWFRSWFSSWLRSWFLEACLWRMHLQFSISVTSEVKLNNPEIVVDGFSLFSFFLRRSPATFSFWFSGACQCEGHSDLLAQCEWMQP